MRNQTSQIYAWALYDWANSAFATVIIAAFFPILFKEYWNVGISATEITFRLGLANAIASILLMLVAPLLGAMADFAGRRKGFLIVFATLGIIMTAGLYWVAEGHWWLAAFVYLLAAFGFAGGNLFYDALLVFVAKSGADTSRQQLDRVSALGFAVGYLGGGLLFAFDIWLVHAHTFFGIADQATAIRIAFLTVAIWWAVFSLPLIFFVKEPPAKTTASPFRHILLGGLQHLNKTLHTIKQFRTIWLFLIAYWLYIDGVHTIIRMAIDYGLSLGFLASNLMMALLVTQFVAFPATLVFGHLGQRIGPKRGILIALGIYLCVMVGAYFITQVWHFYLLAISIGLVQGGVQSLSRSFYARLIPKARSAEFFGFYNLIGKFAAIIGPVMVGIVAVTTDSPRLSILSITLLFILGGALLCVLKVPANSNPST